MIYSYRSDIPELILTVTGEQVMESDCGLQGKDMGRTEGHHQITRPAQKPLLPPGVIAGLQNPQGLICQHPSFPVWRLAPQWLQ